jgi:hypothetical protein
VDADAESEWLLSGVGDDREFGVGGGGDGFVGVAAEGLGGDRWGWARDARPYRLGDARPYGFWDGVGLYSSLQLIIYKF